MKEVKCFMTDDGELFQTKTEAENHEKKLVKTKILRNIMDNHEENEYYCTHRDLARFFERDLIKFLANSLEIVKGYESC